MSSIDAKWPKTLFATLKWHILNVGSILWKQKILRNEQH